MRKNTTMVASNMALIRKALEMCVAEYDSDDKARVAWQAAKDALSTPPRNCDVGTPEEQARRFDAFCAAHMFQAEKCCSSCPCHGAGSCELEWGQLPYQVKGESNEQR